MPSISLESLGWDTTSLGASAMDCSFKAGWKEPSTREYLILVPVSDREPLELKLVLLDERLRNTKAGYSGKTWAGIDGTVLEFKGENRPGRRYLYYHFVVSICRASRFEESRMGRKAADFAHRQSVRNLWTLYRPESAKTSCLHDR